MRFHIVRYPYAMVLTVYLNLNSIQVLISRMNRYYTDDRRYVLLKAPYVSSVRLVFLPGMKLKASGYHKIYSREFTKSRTC